jgi:hypothetical protein
MEYAFGRSEHRVDQEDFGPDFYDATLETAKLGSLLKQMIWIFHLMQNLPQRLVVLISPSFNSIFRMRRVSREQGTFPQSS